MSNLPDRLGDSNAPEIIRASRAGVVVATTTALAWGALSFFGGVGLGVGGGSVRTSGSQAGSFQYSPPNVPAISVAVDDTSTWRVTFSAFVGSGDDTQDSISVTVLRSGAADTLFHAVSGTQAADTISDNTDLKADTTYRVLGRQKGASGGWSDADTVSVLNSITSVSGIVFASEWSTATGTTAAAIHDTDRTRHWVAGGGTAGDGLVVKSTAAEGRDYPTTNFLQHLHPTGSGTDHQIDIKPDSNFIPAPGVDSVIAVRMYYQYRGTVALDPSLTNHPTYFGDSGFVYGGCGSIGGTPVLTFDFGRNGGGFYIRVRGCGGQSAALNQFVDLDGGSPRVYALNTTYRIEGWYHRLTTDTWEIRARVYDNSGNLISSETDFVAWDGGQSSVDMTEVVFDDNDDAGASHMRGFRLGSEGADNSAGSARPLHEWAGLVILYGSDDDVTLPIGPYTAGEAAFTNP